METSHKHSKRYKHSKYGKSRENQRTGLEALHLTINVRQNKFILKHGKMNSIMKLQTKAERPKGNLPFEHLVSVVLLVCEAC